MPTDEIGNGTPDTPSIEDFEADIKNGVIDPFPYQRLMVAYRKQHDLHQELRVIKRAVQVFRKHLEQTQKNILKGHRKRKTIAELSQSISTRTGLIDRKGVAQHVPEPIASWIRRQAAVESKIRAFSAKGRKK